MLIQSPGKSLCVISNLGTKIYPKFIKLRSFFKSKKKIEKIQMDFNPIGLSLFWSLLRLSWVVLDPRHFKTLNYQ